jgi:hypothetical protein
VPVDRCVLVADHVEHVVDPDRRERVKAVVRDDLELASAPEGASGRPRRPRMTGLAATRRPERAHGARDRVR